MEKHWLNEAVFNNAAWCDAIAVTHGITTNWNESVWLCEQPMPPRYPNIVTLKSGSLIDEQISAIDPRLPLGWAIKDSLGDLELEKGGFALAFKAHWYCRLPNQTMSEQLISRFSLSTVKTKFELNRWVTAWGEGNGIFNSSLLENDAIELLYLEQNNSIVSGLATNQSGDSIGISNMFGQPADISRCAAFVAERHPDHGIVGFGDKAEVATLSKLGFEEIGDLRIWLRR